MAIEKLFRKELLAFGGYSAATSPETLDGKISVAVENIIKLDANENPYGCSPRVREALSRYSQFHIYPDDGQERLRKMLSGYVGVDASRIVAGGGSNTLIDLLERLFVEQDDEVINCTPTFGIYSFSTKLCGGRLVEVPRGEDFNIDVARIKSAVTPRTKIIFLANPNNPTGNLTPVTDIEKLLELNLPLVLDEAYYEFSRETAISLVNKYENLIILRTFSKWAGLAGLRVGYGVFPKVVADFLLRIKIPYNVNVAALLAVKESLKDSAYLMTSVDKIIEERARLFSGLQDIEWLRVYPSRANYILCRVLKGEAKDLYKKLQSKGILIRYFDQAPIKDCVRISVGKPEHTDAVLKALKEL